MAATARDSGSLEHSEKAKKEARKAADTVWRFLDRVENSETRAAIQRRCKELEGRVSRFLAPRPAPLAVELSAGGWREMLEHTLDGILDLLLVLGRLVRESLLSRTAPN